jgi:IS30 family transposase
VAMHGCYRHVSRDERGKIMFMFRWGKNCSEIAALLGRHRSTILREMRRNVSQYDSC